MDLARHVVEAVVVERRSYREVARRIPRRTPDALEDEIRTLRKELTDLGVDAGAATIATT